jgi:hypothetical protein
MSIGIFYIKAADSSKGHLRLGNLEQLTAREAAIIRNEIKEFTQTQFENFYIDASNVAEATLSGINEVIHNHYLLSGTNKKIILVYRKNSIVEKWVHTTGLHRFMETALLPAL